MAGLAPAGEPADSVDEQPDELGSLLVPERLGAWSWVLGYTAVLSSLTVLRYHLWLATGYDLGLMEQALWLIWHGGLTAVSTYTNTPVGAIGGAYLLLLVAPFYAVGGVGLLLVLQSFALGLGYPLIRRIGTASGAGERWSHLVGVAYLIYPTLLGANLFDFHPEALAVPLLLAAVWAAVTRRPLAFALAVAGALLAGGPAALVVAGLGVALLLRRQWGLACVALFLAAIAWRFGGPALVSGGVAISGVLRVAAAGRSTAASLIGSAVQLRSWEYLAWVFGPLLGAAAVLRRRALNAWWIPGLVLVGGNLLAAGSAGTSPFTQQSLLAVPFWFAVLVAGSVKPGVVGRRDAAMCLALPVLVLAAFCWHQYHVGAREVPRNAHVLRAAVAEVPAGVPVVAQNLTLAHLADRRQQWLPSVPFTRRVPAGTYVVLDGSATSGLTPAADLKRLRSALAAPGQAKLVSSSKTGATVWSLTRALGPLGTGGRL